MDWLLNQSVYVPRLEKIRYRKLIPEFYVILICLHNLNYLIGFNKFIQPIKIYLWTKIPKKAAISKDLLF